MIFCRCHAGFSFLRQSRGVRLRDGDDGSLLFERCYNTPLPEVRLFCGFLVVLQMEVSEIGLICPHDLQPLSSEVLLFSNMPPPPHTRVWRHCIDDARYGIPTLLGDYQRPYSSARASESICRGHGVQTVYKNGCSLIRKAFWLASGRRRSSRNHVPLSLTT